MTWVLNSVLSEVDPEMHPEVAHLVGIRFGAAAILDDSVYVD